MNSYINELHKLASEWIDQNSHKWSNNTDEVGDAWASFVAGYNKAKETLYTEDDVKEAIRLSTTPKHDGTSLFFTEKEIIKSLKKKS